MTFGLTIHSVTKRFGTYVAVREANLSVPDGKTLVLLGPSGCGKTTLLRIIAGLEQPDSGRVLVAGRDLTGVPARRRGVGMVFQNYALFPHLSVADNVGYGLRCQRIPEREVRQRVDEALASVALSDLSDRYPRQLSGGQQQRVALARAFVVRPPVLLLDEPFGALDLKLRRRMQMELRQLLVQLGTTAVHVTHDQEEALTVADLVAVMHNGEVQQVGSGQELYEAPRSAFVASFLGDANLLPANGLGDDLKLQIGPYEVPVNASGTGSLACLRPERLRLSAESIERSVPVEVTQMVYLGEACTYEVACGETTLRIKVSEPYSDITPGHRAHLILPQKITLVEP